MGGTAVPAAASDDLSGITVVTIEQAVAAPYASSRLGLAGARIIKVEAPGGDFARGYDRLAQGQSAYFVWLNAGKESIAANLKDAGDRALVAAMCARADVVIQNLAPGTLARLGLPLDAMRAADPRLITCSISGYGEEGPMRDAKAYDLLVQAETGLAAINGVGDEPARVGISVADVAAGMSAHAAILQALFVRERTGHGRHIAVSLFSALADWMTVPLLQHRGGRTPRRLGLAHPTIAPYGVFDCADGRPILISIQNEAEWARLCALAGDAERAAAAGFASNAERLANREAVDGWIGGWLATLTRDEAAERLRAGRIAFGRLSDLDDLDAHPQARFVTVQAGEGEIAVMAAPATIDGIVPAPGRVPALDAHGADLRREFAQFT